MLNGLPGAFNNEGDAKAFHYASLGKENVVGAIRMTAEDLPPTIPRNAGIASPPGHRQPPGHYLSHPYQYFRCRRGLPGGQHQH